MSKKRVSKKRVRKRIKRGVAERFLRFMQSKTRLLHNFQVMLSSFMLILGMVVMFFSVYGYMIQFHNIDLSYNMALITNDVNQELKDQNISIDKLNYRLLEDRYEPDRSAPYTEFYLFSADSMPRLIFLAIIGALIFSSGLFWNLGLHTESVKEN